MLIRPAPPWTIIAGLTTVTMVDSYGRKLIDSFERREQAAFFRSPESVAPLGSTKLAPRFVIRTREYLPTAVLIRQDDRKLRTGFCRFQNIFVTVAFRVQDKRFKFFINLKHIGGNGHAVVVPFALIFIDDNFHFSSDATKSFDRYRV
jgi:hypothetical protein